MKCNRVVTSKNWKNEWPVSFFRANGRVVYGWAGLDFWEGPDRRMPWTLFQSDAEACQLGSFSNVALIKRNLENKDIIDTGNGESVFVGPVFRQWLRIRYFKIQRVKHGRVAGGSARDDPWGWASSCLCVRRLWFFYVFGCPDDENRKSLWIFLCKRVAA